MGEVIVVSGPPGAGKSTVAKALAERFTVVYDGVLWPPYAALFATAAGRAFHYALLLPPLEVCLERVRERSDHPFSDRIAATDMWRSFDFTKGSLPTLDALDPPDEVVAEIVGLVESGILRTAR
ncbi:MAG TPA: hypothetical protein VKI23_02740 [Cellulomonadaceae bacterium]|nr:hypothetical protein [Cellulomonadaceae bacterium]